MEIQSVTHTTADTFPLSMNIGSLDRLLCGRPGPIHSPQKRLSPLDDGIPDPGLYYCGDTALTGETCQIAYITQHLEIGERDDTTGSSTTPFHYLSTLQKLPLYLLLHWYDSFSSICIATLAKISLQQLLSINHVTLDVVLRKIY